VKGKATKRKPKELIMRKMKDNIYNDIADSGALYG
jgi:hypothetical protein